MEDDGDEDVDFEDAFYNNYLIIDNYSRPFKNYLQTLKKIEEVDETAVSADENGNIRRVAWNPHRQVIPITNRKQRPKSANYARDGEKRERDQQAVRPKSSCAGYPSRIPVKTQSKCVFDENSRPKSACSLRSNERGFGTRRTNSQPNMARLKNVWAEVNQYRRSLQLLGLSHSDFGQPDSPKRQQRQRTTDRTPSVYGPTFSTRIIKRSFSLDSLKEAVKHEDCPRQLLAQAAYEEWYFKKTEEIVEKLKQEKEAKDEMAKKLKTDRETRNKKSAEHLIKWMESKRKLAKNPKKVSAHSGLMKSKEEIDQAYLDWKKTKTIGKKKGVEIDAAAREQVEKEEKRKQAERAFKEWKSKLVESQRVQKLQENEAREKMRRKLTQQTKPRTSFQTWKQHKDDEFRVKSREARDIAKQTEDTRSMIVTERMYEAEQAFEDWLEKIDNRRPKLKSKSKIDS